MELFKSKAKTDNRRRMEMLSNADGSTQLSFGLQWSSIVSTGGKTTAIKMARVRGASHILFRGQQVGFGYLDIKKNDKVGQIFPAAMVVARQYGGDAIHAIKISDGEYWLAVIRNSQPTSVDQFIFADNDSILAEEVSKILKTAEDEGTKYAVFTNLATHNFGFTTQISAEELLLAVNQDSEFMELLPKTNSVNLPKPVLIAVLVGLVLALGQAGWKWKIKRDALRVAQLKKPVQDEPADVAWARAIKKWKKENPNPDPHGFIAVRESIGTVPATWNGWNLDFVQCKAASVEEDASGLSRSWKCIAEYNRTASGSFNRDMVSKNPPGWVIGFIPLNRMRASWSVNQSVSEFNFDSLKGLDYHYIETLSKLQKYTPIFSQEVSLSFSDLSIPAPKRISGADFEKDPGTPLMKKSILVLKGPLRSIDAVSNLDIPAVWDSISITVSKAKGDKISITQSAILAEVTGALYAKAN